MYLPSVVKRATLHVVSTSQQPRGSLDHTLRYQRRGGLCFVFSFLISFRIERTPFSCLRILNDLERPIIKKIRYCDKSYMLPVFTDYDKDAVFFWILLKRVLSRDGDEPNACLTGTSVSKRVGPPKRATQPYQSC